MSIVDNVKPVNDNHSIKEAVISLFLVTPIIKPERFRELIVTSLNDTFHLFETLCPPQFNLGDAPGIENKNESKSLHNVGFKLTAYRNGMPHKILQGLNDTGSAYISYHILNYNGWVEFIKDFVMVISAIDQFNSGLCVQAFSLQYVDEFLWTGTGPVDHKLLFKQSANVLPIQFYNSLINAYTFATEEQSGSDERFSERLDINVERQLRPAILINHTISKMLGEITVLKDLLSDNNIVNALNKAHLHNKSMLRDILAGEVREMIKLK